MQKHEVLKGASRFNWKDGFYNPAKMEAYKAKDLLMKEENQKGKKQPGKRRSTGKKA